MHRLLREQGYREAIRGGRSPEGGLSGFTPVKRFHRFKGGEFTTWSGPEGRVAFSKLYVFYPPVDLPGVPVPGDVERALLLRPCRKARLHADRAGGDA